MSKAAFPKSMRLLKKQQFAQVRAMGRNRHGKAIVINLYSDVHVTTLKLGITATRKFGKAHVRNLFKRRVREAFRSLDHSLYFPAHLDVRPNHGKLASFSEIRYDIEKLLIKKDG